MDNHFAYQLKEKIIINKEKGSVENISDSQKICLLEMSK